MSTLESVDWALLPVPQDDGGADHLPGREVPPVALNATDGDPVNLAALPGLTIVFAYPMTGVPGRALPQGWDMIPGARGCTPQLCALRDLYAELRAGGAAAVFGLSTQETAVQREAAGRLHVPFPLLSDAADDLACAMDLPAMTVEGRLILRRLTLILRDGVVAAALYPVFPPDSAGETALAWLKANA